MISWTFVLVFVNENMFHCIRNTKSCFDEQISSLSKSSFMKSSKHVFTKYTYDLLENYSKIIKSWGLMCRKILSIFQEGFHAQKHVT